MLDPQDVITLPATKLASYLASKMKRNVGKNRKLGAGVYSFSLPYGKEQSCKDATALCEHLCYVSQFDKRWPSVYKSYQENFIIAKREDFSEILAIALSKLPEAMFRIHTSGDFFSIDYIKAWGVALRANQHIKAFGFTRAWRDRIKREQLEAERMQRYILASIDDETGPCPFGWRPARMETSIPLKDIESGLLQMPRGICNEMNSMITNRANNGPQPCIECGRCPLFKDIGNGLVPLVANAALHGVVFPVH